MPRSVFLSREYLEHVERTAPVGLVPRYVIVYRDLKAVAALSLQLLPIALSNVASETDAEGKARLVQRPAEVLRSRIRARVLVCGNLFSWGSHGVAFADGVNPEEVWPGIAEALYRVRRAEKLAGNTGLVLIKDLEGGLWDTTDPLDTYSYREFDTEPNMVLELSEDCAGFEDYLSRLNARYRKSARKIIRQIDDAGISVVSHGDPLGSEIERLYELFEQVHGSAAVRLVTPTIEYLAGLPEAFAGGFRWTLLKREGEVLGFVTTVRDGDTAIGYYIGFDRDANADLPIYFRLLYAVVEDMFALGCRRVSLGRTALEPKARLGATPVPMRCRIRHRIPLLNAIVRQLLRTVSHDEAPDRSPFKAKPSGESKNESRGD
ncbi:MAG: GNAT family N-acetyltransferase [Planctomycetota bacterium]